MRIYGPNGTAVATARSPARRAGAGSGTFSLGEEQAPSGPAATGGPRTVSTVDALIALQGVEDPAERRKRAVRKGRDALDVLDALKLALLDGNLDQSTLGRLKSAAEGLKQATGDSGLDAVLGEIELRVEVELAKAGIR
jgi:hypothetical protein